MLPLEFSFLHCEKILLSLSSGWVFEEKWRGAVVCTESCIVLADVKVLRCELRDSLSFTDWFFFSFFPTGVCFWGGREVESLGHILWSAFIQDMLQIGRHVWLRNILVLSSLHLAVLRRQSSLLVWLFFAYHGKKLNYLAISFNPSVSPLFGDSLIGGASSHYVTVTFKWAFVDLNKVFNLFSW